MIKINQIWSDLEKDHSISQGILLRLYSASVVPDVYAAMQYPEKIRCLCIVLSQSVELQLTQFSNLQEIEVSLFPSPNEKDKKLLLFKLLNPLHQDIFAVLCEDLISSIASETDEKKVVRVVLNRFEKWKSLFTKIASEGLQPEAQRGLYGELYFLRKFIQINTDYIEVVNTWIGTEKEVRDFQSRGWAVEIKTTHGNNHQKILISSERQLDNTHLDLLYLYHISLERMQNSGETLNDIVGTIVKILQTDILALNRFRTKLCEVGYFDFQKNLYENIGYFVRQDVFYKVEGDFPRIQENEVRAGVGDVKYSIIVAQCSAYIETENVVFINVIP